MSAMNVHFDFCFSGTSIQIVGMSATIPNLDLLASWLDANVFQTDYRPVPLIECVKYGKLIFDNKLSLLREIQISENIENDTDHLLHLVYETVAQKLGVLIFCPTKNRCEVLAETTAKMIYSV